MKRSILFIVLFMTIVSAKAQLVPVANLELSTQEGYVLRKNLKTKKEEYIPGGKVNIAGSVKVEYFESGKTTYFTIETSTLGAAPVVYTVEYSTHEKRQDGVTIYNIQCRDFKGRTSAWILIYRANKLRSVNLDMGDDRGFVQFE